jgi:molybdopterin converting factor subunit 1
MNVTVQLFARAKDLARSDKIAVELTPGATVRDLRRQLAAAYPVLADLLQRSALAVNEEFADDDAALSEQDKIALLPPVSGG